MKKIKFLVDVGVVGYVREVIDEFEDDVTEEELEEYERDLVWNYVSVCHKEVEKRKS